jgi:predicted ABC-class ATPase
LVLAEQELALEALQTAASTQIEEQKVATLSKTNDAANQSIITAIKQCYSPQSAAIPMLFAVFSRKNDGYGQG